MGNWQLEVGKFAFYVFAPVMSFYIYHRVDYFKDDLLKFERKTQTPERLLNQEKLREDMKLLQRLREMNFKESLQKEAQKE
jgi:hypothetical protein